MVSPREDGAASSINGSILLPDFTARLGRPRESGQLVSEGRTITCARAAQSMIATGAAALGVPRGLGTWLGGRAPGAASGPAIVRQPTGRGRYFTSPPFSS